MSQIPHLPRRGVRVARVVRGATMIASGAAAAVLALALTACVQPIRDPSPQKTLVETRSLGGEPLLRARYPRDRRQALEADLEAAERAYAAAPYSEEAVIWYGRRLAYLGRYYDAIEAFSEGLQRHPESFRLLRHRGHRYITVRELDKAVADLTRASELIEGVPDEVEPDGAPNAQNKPRSTNHANIWYHLGLAHYLKGQYSQAAEAWRRGLEFSRANDDMLVATSYWLYLAERRAGGDAAAVLEPIKAEMDVIENFAYHRLLRMFKGELQEAQVREGAGEGDVADATVGYGIGVGRLFKRDHKGAFEVFEQVLSGPNWAAFGYIASEAEVVRER